MVNANAQSQDDPILLAHAKTDAFLREVTEQIDLDTFDPDDSEILKQLVECMGDSRGMTRLRFAETLAEIGEAATPFCWMVWRIILIQLCGVRLLKL